jgi:hypothetical protein
MTPIQKCRSSSLSTAELRRSIKEGFRVAAPDDREIIQPADDVHCWLEADSSIMLKAITRFGDPVELSADEAREIAAALMVLANKLEPL